MSGLTRRLVSTARAAHEHVLLGTGSMTVVFVNGMGTPLEEWSLVAEELADAHRLLLYDRRAATEGEFAHSAAEMAADLDALLSALGLSGPYLLVGHSWGGLLLRAFAAAHPRDVAGLVFVDASHEALLEPIMSWFGRVSYRTLGMLYHLPGVRRRVLRASGFGQLSPAEFAAVDRWVSRNRATGQAEFDAIPASCAELAAHAPFLPHLPTRILIAGRATLGFNNVPRSQRVWEKAIRGLADAAIQVVPHAGHYVPLDAPDAVVAAIRELAAVAQKPLPD